MISLRFGCCGREDADTTEGSTEDSTEDITEDVAEDIPEDITEDVTGDIAEEHERRRGGRSWDFALKILQPET